MERKTKYCQNCGAEIDVNSTFCPKCGFKVASTTQQNESYPVNRHRIPKRDIVVVYILGIVTFGVYFIYWLYMTKHEINRLGAHIPTTILIIIPIANIYWLFRYSEGFSLYVKKDNNYLLWFIVFFLIIPVMPAIVQSELNNIADQMRA